METAKARCAINRVYFGDRVGHDSSAYCPPARKPRRINALACIQTWPTVSEITSIRLHGMRQRSCVSPLSGVAGARTSVKRVRGCASLEKVPVISIWIQVNLKEAI